MFDLSAPIIPGKSAAGIKLNQSIEEVIKFRQPYEIHSLGGSTKHDFKQIDLWVKHGKIFQIGVKLDCQGYVQEKIGIGSRIHDVQSAFGKVIEDGDDNLVVLNSSGWCFETEVWQNGQGFSENLNARITEIFVFIEDEKV